MRVGLMVEIFLFKGLEVRIDGVVLGSRIMS